MPDGPRSAACSFVQRLYARIFDHLPQAYRDELAGIAQGAGLPPDLVFRASFLSEVFQVLAATGRHGGSKENAAAHGGCTAGVVLSARSALATPIHAKNQDYDGAGYWDRVPVLHVSRIVETSPYAKATSAGLLKGNLSFNAAGLSLGGHFLLSENAGADGVSFTVAENEIMRHADCLNDAERMLSESRRLGSFAFVATDAKADDAAVFECDGAAISRRPAQEGALGMANLYVPGMELLWEMLSVALS